jgi:hypothetical protein
VTAVRLAVLVRQTVLVHLAHQITIMTIPALLPAVVPLAPMAAKWTVRVVRLIAVPPPPLYIAVTISVIIPKPPRLVRVTVGLVPYPVRQVITSTAKVAVTV